MHCAELTHSVRKFNRMIGCNECADRDDLEEHKARQLSAACRIIVGKNCRS
jgi:hypothetical protein